MDASSAFRLKRQFLSFIINPKRLCSAAQPTWRAILSRWAARSCWSERSETTRRAILSRVRWSPRIGSRAASSAQAHHPTTTKVRYVSGGQQIMRLDIERPFKLEARKIQAICDWLVGAADTVSAIVLSDYAKGVLVPALIQRVVAIAKARRIPVVVDPKSPDVSRYEGATVLTPNASEAAMIVGVDCADDDRAENAVRIFRERAKVEAVVLTRGANGMTIFDPAEAEGAVTHVPAVASQVFDVSGAGDTVVAALALALACGASVTTAARIGNAAAGIAVSKRGTAVVHAEELSAVLGGVKDRRRSENRRQCGRPPPLSPIGRPKG